MYGPFCFGLIDRCVRKGKWINWAILGGVLAWSSAQQPDLWLMFGEGNPPDSKSPDPAV